MLEFNGRRRELSGAESDTTNNRMELTAAVQALHALKRSCHVVLYTDSMYVRQGITEWLERWKRNGWKTAARQPVRNQDLWRELDAQASRHHIDWCWVKGHAGNPGNELADELAGRAIDDLGACRS